MLKSLLKQAEEIESRILSGDITDEREMLRKRKNLLDRYVLNNMDEYAELLTIYNQKMVDAVRRMYEEVNLLAKYLDKKNYMEEVTGFVFFKFLDPEDSYIDDDEDDNDESYDRHLTKCAIQSMLCDKDIHEEYHNGITKQSYDSELDSWMSFEEYIAPSGSSLPEKLTNIIRPTQMLEHIYGSLWSLKDLIEVADFRTEIKIN